MLTRVRHFKGRPSQELAGTTPRTGQAPVCFNLNLGAGASEVSSTTSMVACWRFLASTFSHASLPSFSVFYRPVCTYCSRVFVGALPLTSTHRRALHQEHLSSSSVQTTWASHYVSRKIAHVSNPAARDRTVPHREQGRARCVPTYSSKPVLFLTAISSSIRHVGCVGGVPTSGTSDGQASGTPAVSAKEAHDVTEYQ